MRDNNGNKVNSGDKKPQSRNKAPYRTNWKNQQAVLQAREYGNMVISSIKH